jgi:hypothetical protein
MPFRAPVSYHLDLYRYWLGKRGIHPIPARRDIDPGDIPALLPHIMIIDKVDGQLRWRLVGTGAVRQVGRDPTGSLVGSNSTPETAAAARAVYERVFTTAYPILAVGEFKVMSGAIIKISQLILPLSDDGANVNMAISTIVARFGVPSGKNWLKEVPLKLGEVAGVVDGEDLEKRCLDWERDAKESG